MDTTTFSFDRLKAKGFQRLRGFHQEDLPALLAHLGTTIQETQVVVNPNSKSLVTSTRDLDYHTDHHKAHYIVWYCHEQTSEGGQSLLMDTEKIWGQLSGEEQQALKNIHLFEHKVFEDDEEQYPLVTEEADGQRRFYYSFWLVNEQDRNNEALRHFQALLRNTEPVQLTLQPGDVLIVNNHRVLHGRTAITGSPNRHLTRYWVTT